MSDDRPTMNAPPVATVFLSVVTIAAVVATLAITHDTNTTLIVGVLVINFSMQVIGNRKTDDNRKGIEETKVQIAETKQQVEHVGDQINGRMNDLLAVSGEAKELAGKAAGLVEGHAAGMIDQKELQAARDSNPNGST